MTNIDDLRITEWLKTSHADSLPPRNLAGLKQTGFVLDTCLRRLCIAIDSPRSVPGAKPAGMRSYRGSEAYQYMLEVATGLQSAVPGETNVFGQFKKAWQHYRDHADPLVVARLAPWVHRLINDARVVRSSHLHGIGGASYGSLVRRLISPHRGDRVLLVGTGDLAASIAPLFDKFRVGVWNHRPTTFTAASSSRHFAPNQGAVAAAWADHVIFTTPPDEKNDSSWRQWLEGAGVRTLTHLGHRRGELSTWSVCATSFDLDDVFALRKTQNDLRSNSLERARLACRDAARDIIGDRVPASPGHLAHV